MLGWRGRFGYVSPSTIHLPWELTEMLPEGVGVIATVLSVRVHSDAEFERALAGARGAIDIVVGEGARAVVLAGVPVAVRQGYRAEQTTHQAWSEEVGVPVTSGVAAAVQGLKHLGTRRPVVATAYLETINQQIERYLTEAELQVETTQGLAVQSPAEASRVEAPAYYQLARSLLEAHPQADSVFLGGRIDLQQVVLDLEQDLGVPVVTGTQAGLWWALRQLRIRAGDVRASSLLRSDRQSPSA